MTKKITFPRWPSEFPANLGRPLCLSGLTGRHWLAGNSEGHRRISKFLFLMVPYNYYGALATGNREVAFFHHLESQSYIVCRDVDTVKPQNSGHFYGQNFSAIDGFSAISKVQLFHRRYK